MPGRVLDGVRILDLTRIVAGPYATAILADLGAEVIKVERPTTGDDYRYGPSHRGQTSLSFQNTNRGKRSITLDVRQTEGRELFLRLAERADAVVENFRAGWLAARGLGADVIQARNPRCVVASLSGFGATGPRAGQASYDIVAQAAGGLLAMTGFADAPPVRGGGALADFVGGLYLALGVVAALRERDHTGRARILDLSNQDAVFAITDSAATIMAGIGVPSERVGNQHPFTAPYDAFEAKAEKVRYDAAITVDGDVEAEGEVGVRELAGGPYAVVCHQGPYNELGTTYDFMYGRWLSSMGYEPADAPPFEHYLNEPESTEPEELLTDVHVPLRM